MLDRRTKELIGNISRRFENLFQLDPAILEKYDILIHPETYIFPFVTKERKVAGPLTLTETVAENLERLELVDRYDIQEANRELQEEGRLPYRGLIDTGLEIGKRIDSLRTPVSQPISYTSATLESGRKYQRLNARKGPKTLGERKRILAAYYTDRRMGEMDVIERQGAYDGIFNGEMDSLHGMHPRQVMAQFNRYFNNDGTRKQTPTTTQKPLPY